ncbi:cuticle collagen 8-like [Sapajus apella]|uniref:Cuticle collagen 8-like n=1 Tax=Sapajus apella TaxID=9515 RepID=A0A6J3IRF8_SAPAP|nr:cuticle collagen 8-like [Sapajus apella]
MHGRRRGRGIRWRRGPSPAPAVARLAPGPQRRRHSVPKGPAAFAQAGGEGRREEAAGVGTTAEPPPQRPLRKARSLPPGPRAPPGPGLRPLRLRVGTLGANWTLGQDLDFIFKSYTEVEI